MMTDAIRACTSEHAVYFLLTDYLETLARGEAALSIAPSVLRLPLQGREDVAARFRCLIEALVAPAQSMDAGVAAQTTDALRVFGAAVHTLKFLEQAPS